MLLTDPRLKTIIECRGFDTQCDKLIEEQAELVVAITHERKKDKDALKWHDNFIEELGDVAILVSQLYASLSPEDQITFKESVSFKINREMERLDRDGLIAKRLPV